MSTDYACEAFGPVPIFEKLCARFKRMEIEQPNAVLTSPQPFVRFDDDRPVFQPGALTSIMHRTRVTTECVLQREVETLRKLLLRGAIATEALPEIEVWSQAAIDIVECACETYDQRMARFKTVTHTIN